MQQPHYLVLVVVIERFDRPGDSDEELETTIRTTVLKQFLFVIRESVFI